MTEKENWFEVLRKRAKVDRLIRQSKVAMEGGFFFS